MSENTLFGSLLGATYRASGTNDPLELYYATMFAEFFAVADSQPSCSRVQKILRGKSKVPWKVLQFYHDPDNPRCPGKLAQDLSALADYYFRRANHREALRNCLLVYLENLPEADQEDLVSEIPDDDLIGLWTRLTWYALCGDHHE